jgi:hypothetical protein
MAAVTERVAVVANEIEAEMLCAMLRTEGIEAAHRKTDVAAGAWRGAPGAGPREILVAPEHVERAREMVEKPG